MLESLFRRHIQDFASATNLSRHWGYADRVVPCTNDAGSCEYLDVVYRSHDLGMYYVGAMWLLIVFLTVVVAVSRRTNVFSSLRGKVNRYLLPDIPRHWRLVFGRATRLQLVILSIVLGYLFIFSFVGITYKKWVTPVKNMEGVYNTRTSLGPWSDRMGVLAYALIPLSILLASRESILASVTGISYHHFIFFHRWVGHIIFMQSALHTIGWFIVEARLYQPQPSVVKHWIVQNYMIWGLVAMILLIILWGTSLTWSQRKIGYELWRKIHYVLAMVFIGACIPHWANLMCFLVPSILLWGIDRFFRLGRAYMVNYRDGHSNKGLFPQSTALVTRFDTNVVRLDIPLLPVNSWKPGQLAFLTFPDSVRGIWQSHPFTIMSLPAPATANCPCPEENIQSFVIRAREGETQRLMGLTATAHTLPVIITGPYGANIYTVPSHSNLFCVAGGTGIAYVLPVLLSAIRNIQSVPKSEDRESQRTLGQIRLVWAIRNLEDKEWIKTELRELVEAAGKGVDIKISLFCTRYCVEPSTPDSASGVLSPITLVSEGQGDVKGDIKGEPKGDILFDRIVTVHQGRPVIDKEMDQFFNQSGEEGTHVYVSGPVAMITESRTSTAKWIASTKGDVQLHYDDRLED